MDQEREGRNVLWQKTQLILALVVTALLAALLLSLAWLNYSRSLVTATNLNMPTLWLRGGRGQDTVSIELSNINVEDSSVTKKRCIFSVVSTQDNPYIIQLAYTTNIGLTYRVYPTTATSGEEVMGVALEGRQLAIETTGPKTYGTDINVQVNANPVYWQSVQQEYNESDYTESIGRTYVRYYVLEIDWTPPEGAGSNLKNDKETDMIYLTVGNVAPNESAAGENA